MAAPQTAPPEPIDPVRDVVEQLEEEIVFGRLRPRERLVEEELAARFQVKRHFIRQALFELERVGIVVRPRGRGARVREFTPEQVEDLYLVRELLETKAAMVMPLPVDPTLIDELDETLTVHAEAVKAGDIKVIYRTNIRFHQLLFGASKNPYLTEAIDLFRHQGQRDPFLSRPRSGDLRESLQRAPGHGRGAEGGRARHAHRAVPRPPETFPRCLYRGVSRPVRQRPLKASALTAAAPLTRNSSAFPEHDDPRPGAVGDDVFLVALLDNGATSLGDQGIELRPVAVGDIGVAVDRDAGDPTRFDDAQHRVQPTRADMVVGEGCRR